jgi:Uma2 family endonuclease
MGWLIDPEDQSVFVYRPDQPTAVFDHPDEALPAPAFAQDFAPSIADLLAWLME